MLFGGGLGADPPVLTGGRDCPAMNISQKMKKGEKCYHNVSSGKAMSRVPKKIDLLSKDQINISHVKSLVDF